MSPDSKHKNHWTFFSNNAHVLVCLCESPQPTTSEIARRVGISERATQRIVQRLADAGVVRIEKNGRRNTYSLNLDQRLRHPLESHKSIGEFLSLIKPNSALVRRSH